MVSATGHGAFGIFALVAALYFLAGSYVYRREPRFAREPGRVAMICGLVILALAIVRILAAQTWNAEVVPVAIAGDDRGDRLQSELRHDDHVRAVDLDLRSRWGPRCLTSWC